MSPEHLLFSTERALLHRLASAQVRGRTPSMVAGVVRDGALVWSGGYGTVGGSVGGSSVSGADHAGVEHGGEYQPTRDTQYRIGSITKTFVAVAVLRLRDEGLFTLTDQLGELLPEAAAIPAIAKAWISDLLSHTDGLGAETPPPWWERVDGSVRPKLKDLLGDGPLPHDPGRHFHYSNVGYGLLGALVGHLRGKSWDQVVRDEILLPLQMERTTIAPQQPHADGWAVHPWADVVLPEPAEDAGLMAPAGQLWSTIDDIGRFADFLLGGAPDVLSAQTLREMRTPAAPPSTAGEDPMWDQGYGLGLQLTHSHGRNLFGHTGSMPGFLAAVWASHSEHTAAICFANSTSGPLISGIASDLLDIVVSSEPRLPKAWSPESQTPSPELFAATGPWYWGATPVALRLRDGGLELTGLVGVARAARFRLTDGMWRGLDGYYHGETLTIERDDEGLPTHLTLASFVFTRQPYDPDVNAVPGGVDPGGWRGQESAT